MLQLRKLSTQQDNFKAILDQLLAWESLSDQKVMQSVADIIHRVKQQGDQAVLELTKRFDQLPAASVSDLEVSQVQLEEAYTSIPEQQRQALEKCGERIKQYAQRQTLESWSYTESDGTVLGQQVSAMDRVGLYVPGGKACYPSSVLMNAIPAKVAGVNEVIMVTPAPKGECKPLVLAAAKIAGVDRVFKIGGAQAVAALAYGTDSIPSVDKIVGPGNIYVATAKRLVFGTVGIDMLAGPSEIVVVCDGKTHPDWIAMDLFSQAEHDEDAQAILISPDQTFIDRVEASIEKQLQSMERADIITESINTRGALVHAKDLDEAIDIVNHIAPEHVELSIDDAERWAKKIRHAGAIFLGRYTAEALGDYCAGPNHVLPTSRTARFTSPLGVYDFLKRSSIIACSEQGASELGKTASVIARGEGLTAHARSAEFRIKRNG